MKLTDTRNDLLEGRISKSDFIRIMYETHHSKLFDYASYLKMTNIASIEIFDDEVLMTSRDKAVRIFCPLGDYRVAPIEALNFLDYETEDSAMIMRLAENAKIVLDVGANMGWYSINVAVTFPACHIHAFEPIPKTYTFLERNIKLNGVNNIHSYPFGFSNEKKKLTFYFYPEGSGNASSENVSDRIDAELISCRVERMDEFVKSKELSVDFIKCDVEGAELFVFQGGKETINRDKPIVFTEMLRKWALKFNYHPNEIITFFSNLGYLCFHVKGEELIFISEMTERTVETNFFFLHVEKHAEQISNLCKTLSR